MAESKLGFNYLDRLLAGEELTLNDQVRYWRTRYLLIPSGRDPLTAQGVVPKGEQFNPAEILFTGAYKVLEILQRYQWRQRDTDEPVHLRLLPTTFDPSACVLDDGLMSELERLTVNEEVLRKTGLTLEGMTLQALADMMCKEKNGLIIRERWWHCKWLSQNGRDDTCLLWRSEADHPPSRDSRGCLYRRAILRLAQGHF
jgi:hypothetical protein